MRIETNNSGAAISEEEGGQGSPRTKVAYHFEGLQLEGGAPVSKLNLMKNIPPMEDGTEDPKDDDLLRKRVKILKDRETEIPETPKAFTISIGPERTTDSIIPEKAKQVILQNELDPIVFKGNTSDSKGSGLARAYPSINRLADSKSRGRKRMSTPPLFGSAGASIEEDPPVVVDPDRAALTWHDDEITGHNPDDPDDDGEGINGIGFRPTPAIAYARTEKRRQQMTEYKNREAKEARARRSERRRGNDALKSESREGAETVRRVRFLEAEAKSVIFTS